MKKKPPYVRFAITNDPEHRHGAVTTVFYENGEKVRVVKVSHDQARTITSRARRERTLAQRKESSPLT